MRERYRLRIGQVQTQNWDSGIFCVDSGKMGSCVTYHFEKIHRGAASFDRNWSRTLKKTSK